MGEQPMNTLALILGGGSGVLLRMFVERAYRAKHPETWRNSLALTAIGAFVLGIATGVSLAIRHPGEFGNALTVALSAALFTYCVFSGAAIHLIGRFDGRRALTATAVHTVGGFAAAVPGVLFAAWTISH